MDGKPERSLGGKGEGKKIGRRRDGKMEGRGRG